MRQGLRRFAAHYTRYTQMRAAAGRARRRKAAAPGRVAPRPRLWRSANARLMGKFGLEARPGDIDRDPDHSAAERRELLEALGAQVDHLAVGAHLVDVLPIDHIHELDPDALVAAGHAAPAPVQVQVGGHGGVEAVALIAVGQIAPDLVQADDAVPVAGEPGRAAVKAHLEAGAGRRSRRCLDITQVEQFAANMAQPDPTVAGQLKAGALEVLHRMATFRQLLADRVAERGQVAMAAPIVVEAAA